MSHLHAPSLNVQNSELQIEFVFVCLRDIFNNEFSSSTKFERFENFLLKRLFNSFQQQLFPCDMLEVPIWNVLHLER